MKFACSCGVTEEMIESHTLPEKEVDVPTELAAIAALLMSGEADAS